jgi:hypothetical protein
MPTLAETKKVHALEGAVKGICVDVALKLDVLEITYKSRMIHYDELDKPALFGCLRFLDILHLSLGLILFTGFRTSPSLA